MNENHNVQFSWILFVKQIFNYCGFSEFELHNSPKAINNRIFKTEFKYEEYLNILEIKDAILFCKFRTTNNKLPHRDRVMEEHTKRKS